MAGKVNEVIVSFNLITWKHVPSICRPHPTDYAGMLSMMYAQVTCFEYADQLLPREDPDAAKVLEKALGKDGLTIRLGQPGLIVCIFSQAC